MKTNTKKILIGLFLAFLSVCLFVPIFVTEQAIMEDCEPVIALGHLTGLFSAFLIVCGSVSVFVLDSTKESCRPNIGIGG